MLGARPTLTWSWMKPEACEARGPGCTASGPEQQPCEKQGWEQRFGVKVLAISLQNCGQWVEGGTGDEGKEGLHAKAPGSKVGGTSILVLVCV